MAIVPIHAIWRPTRAETEIIAYCFHCQIKILAVIRGALFQFALKNTINRPVPSSDRVNKL